MFIFLHYIYLFIFTYLFIVNISFFIYESVLNVYLLSRFAFIILVIY